MVLSSAPLHIETKMVNVSPGSSGFALGSLHQRLIFLLFLLPSAEDPCIAAGYLVLILRVCLEELLLRPYKLDRAHVMTRRTTDHNRPACSLACVGPGNSKWDPLWRGSIFHDKIPTS
jgi:hypothetical protein